MVAWLTKIIRHLSGKNAYYIMPYSDTEQTCDLQSAVRLRLLEKQWKLPSNSIVSVALVSWVVLSDFRFTESTSRNSLGSVPGVHFEYIIRNICK